MDRNSVIPMGKNSSNEFQEFAVDSSGRAITAPGTPVTGTLTDRSGTVAAGDDAQTIAAANTSRKYFMIQNNSAGDLWFNVGTAAVKSQPSVRLEPGDGFVFDAFVPTALVSVIGATTGQAFTAKEG